MNDTLEKKLSLLPEDPGVYVMLDKEGTIIYVGKAKVLKNRVRQYFHSGDKPEKVAAMVANISDFYYIITRSEIDALSLENNLIKKHKPRYNILLKDDKTYPYIKVNLKEKFPSFVITRKLRKDGCRYFGPFMGGVNAKDTLEIVNCAFLVRPCSVAIGEKFKKECLNYHLGKCLAPCAGLCSEEEYRRRAEEAVDFLAGNDEGVEEILKSRMEKFAALEEFELALSYREKLRMLEKIRLKRITALNKFVNADIIATASDGVYGVVNLLVTRSGRMQGGKNFAFDDLSETDGERLKHFVMQYYSHGQELPDEIVVSGEIADGQALAEYFRREFGRSVLISTPERGIRRQLADMAKKNAEDYLAKEVERIRHKDDMTRLACKKLKETLGLRRYPKRMECYDISHVSGVDKVGSMVVFCDGEPDKNAYRRFRIRTVEGSDDFACLREVLSRRLAKLGTDEEEKFPRPDLVVIDGGKGQLSAVKEVFGEKYADIDVISLAKREEEIFTETSEEPVVLPRRDFTLRMLQRLRDEAHRFAITYHRATHEKRNLASALDEAEGVGKIRKKALLAAFGSVENIRRATVEELTAVEGIGRASAETILRSLNGKKENALPPQTEEKPTGDGSEEEGNASSVSDVPTPAESGNANDMTEEKKGDRL